VGKIPDLIIRCSCGWRVASRDVLQHRFLLSIYGASHFYVRYRCARCQRVGERYIPEDQWDPGLVGRPGSSLSEAQTERFRRMGEITLDEMIDFHFALERLSAGPEEK